MQYTPIIISHESEPSRCPQCKRPENIKRVCRECGYEYSEEMTAKEIALVIVIILLIAWIVGTIIFWIVDRDKSLLDYFIAQWDYIKELKLI